MAKQDIKVLRKANFNIAHLIFLCFFIYMVVLVGKYISKEDVKICEVTEGSLVQNHNYTGVILRSEILIKAETEGYVKCYVADGARINKDGIVFAIDKSGATSQSSVDGGSSTITEKQYRSLRKYLNHFSTKYDGQDYTSVYTFKDQLITTLYGIEQEEAESQEANSSLLLNRTDISGVVYFTLDGLETLQADMITKEWAENIEFSGSRVLTGDFVNKNDVVCKIITDESWSIVIPITEDDAEYYAERSTAKILLTDIDAEVTADIELYTDANGEKLAKLTLDKYMSSYASERMVSFQLIKNITTGLKVPKTSIAANELYVIPKAYGKASDADNKIYFQKENTDKAGTLSKEVVNYSICYSDDQYYYIDDPDLQPGDIFYQVTEGGTLGTNTYTVGEKKTLKGVYNVNKGYVVFEVVNILEENDSYCIVEGGTTYGLAVYDHIVLNASTVSEDDLLY